MLDLGNDGDSLRSPGPLHSATAESRELDYVLSKERNNRKAKHAKSIEIAHTSTFLYLLSNEAHYHHDPRLRCLCTLP